MMPAIVWVQFTALGFFFLCLAGVYWLDPTIWSLTKVEPFTALSKIVNPPLLSFLDALIGHRFHYSVIVVFGVGYGSVASVTKEKHKRKISFFI